MVVEVFFAGSEDQELHALYGLVYGQSVEYVPVQEVTVVSAHSVTVTVLPA